MKLKDNLSSFYIFGYLLEFRIEFGGFFFNLKFWQWKNYENTKYLPILKISSKFGEISPKKHPSSNVSS
jgi:hypothetical protein